MRKVILGCGITLDGYIARLDGSVDFLVMPKGAAKVAAAFYATIDTIVFGRKTFDAMQRMIAQGEHAGPAGPWKTYVFSRTLPSGERDGMTFVKESPAAFLRKLRRKPGKHICHMGGGELARSFLQADLVDELWMHVVPILLGAGIPIFPAGFPQRDFKLVECRTYGNDISLIYSRARKSRARKKGKGRKTTKAR
jgi:dihydrofolate reductase